MERIYFSIYRFKLIPQGHLLFPGGNAGTALRGAFGHSLKRIVCIIDKNADCLTCPVAKTCVFQIVFYPVQAEGSAPKRQRTPPRGFVIKPPLNSKVEYRPGEPFIFDFLLVGRLGNYLPYIIVPFKELGEVGIGTRRGKFTLEEIASVKPIIGRIMCKEKESPKQVAEQVPSPLMGEGRACPESALGGEGVGVNSSPLPPPTRGEYTDSTSDGLDLSSPSTQQEQERRDGSLDLSRPSVRQEQIESIYSARDGIVRNINGRVTMSDLMEKMTHAKPTKVTLNFLTPTQIKYNPTGEKGKSRIVKEPDFHHIARRLRDRIDALSRFYCDGPLDIDYKGFGERAEKIKTISKELRWTEQSRRSRQGHQHDLSGFVGKITFEGNLEEFLPFLILGQYLHVGENAVFGSGRYGVEILV